MNLKLKKDSVIICPNNRKEELIEYFSSSFDYGIKYISREDLIKELTYSYDYDAVLFLMKEKKYSFDNAKEILDNLHFIDNYSKTIDEISEKEKIVYKKIINILKFNRIKEIKINSYIRKNKKIKYIGKKLSTYLFCLKNTTVKLSTLVDIKRLLIEKKFLKTNPLFRKKIENKDKYIYGYSSFDFELENLLVNENINFTKLKNMKKIKKTHKKITRFENIEDEVKYFFRKVCFMHSQGIDINDILLYSYPSEYDFILRKYSKIFNVPINFESNYYLYESPLYKEFIDLIKEKSYEESIEILKEKDERFNVVGKLIDLCNKVLSVTSKKEEQIFLIDRLSKNIKIKERDYQNAINIVSSDYRGKKHVFLLGFSLGSYPIIKKDTDFLLDIEKKCCNQNTSKIENKINNDNLKDFILSNPNLYISFKKKVGKTVFYDSLLISELKIKDKKIEYKNFSYSEDLAKLEVAECLDVKYDYGIESPYVNAMNEEEIEYKKFNNNFKHSPIFINDNEMKISFSLIDDYVRCPFKYFIKRICGAEVFEDNFYSKLGTIIHDALEKSLKEEVRKEDYQKQIESNFESKKERLFVNKLFDQVYDVIQKNNRFKIISSFTEEYGEQELFYRLDNKTTLNGKIDKIILNEKEKEIIVVDYKTGATTFNKKEVPIGLSLQLPVYSLLISKNYPEYSQTGIYIQNVLSDDENIEGRYKLKGISINSDDKLSRLEHALSKYSKYISGLALFSNGYKNTNSLVTKEEFEEIVSMGETILTESLKNIREGNFPISPIYVNGKDKVCKDCPLSSVCFKNEDNHRYVKLKDLDEEE